MPDWLGPSSWLCACGRLACSAPRLQSWSPYLATRGGRPDTIAAHVPPLGALHATPIGERLVVCDERRSRARRTAASGSDKRAPAAGPSHYPRVESGGLSGSPRSVGRSPPRCSPRSRLLRPPRVISSEVRAMQSALHAATVMLPAPAPGPLDAERGASRSRTCGRSRRRSAVALADRERLLAFDGAGGDHHARGEVARGPRGGRTRDDRVHVESADRAARIRTARSAPRSSLRSSLGGERVGIVRGRIRARAAASTPDDTRTVAGGGEPRLRPDRAGGARGPGRATRPRRAAGAAGADLAALHLQRAGRDRRLHPLQSGRGARAADRVRRVHPLRVPRPESVRDAGRRARTTSRSTCASSARASATRLEVRLEVAPEVLHVGRAGALAPAAGRERGPPRRRAAGGARPGGDHRPRHRRRRRAAGARRRRRAWTRGPGRRRSWPAQGGGIGVANVQARLQTTLRRSDYGLEIDSPPGQGTTVTMTLPKFRAGVRGALSAGARLRVLAVDDERPALEDLARLLRGARRRWARSCCAEAGADALRALAERPFDATVPRRADARRRRARARRRAAPLRRAAAARVRQRLRGRLPCRRSSSHARSTT